jgi:N-methylhydantoinase B
MNTMEKINPRAATAAEFDPIAMEVFSNRLLSITEEMGNTLIRSAFSSNIKERKDCSVAIFNANGYLVVQAAHIPIHLGSLAGGVRSVLQTYAVDELQPGDAFISNDAYLAGGSHAPDITIVTPVFWEGTLQFFVACIGHHTDVGGAVPGSTAHNLKTVWEEGLRLPTMRIMQDGAINRELIHMIAHNTREPENRVHDLHAQIATNERGVKLLHELLRITGLDEIKSSVAAILAYTERRLRNTLRQLPRGPVTFTELMDDDGLGGDPVPITVTIKVVEDQIHVDFAGSGAQARGAFNVPENALRASVYFAVKTMLDPELMPNNGMFEPITVSAPEGTILNPAFPAAVGGRAMTAQHAAGAVVGALCQLLPPEKSMASCNDVLPAMVFSGPSKERRGTFVYLETLGGGAGGRAAGDGMDGIQVHITNTSNLPAEALEIEYPLLVEEYALVNDSGGAGAFRGGMGIARQVRSLDDRLVCAVRCDGTRFGAAGMYDGQEGRTARTYLNYLQADGKALPGKVSGLALLQGQSVRLETPGGGGLGDPRKRPVELLAADLRGEKVSVAQAQKDYGSALVDAALQLNKSTLANALSLEKGSA